MYNILYIIYLNLFSFIRKTIEGLIQVSVEKVFCPINHIQLVTLD